MSGRPEMSTTLQDPNVEPAGSASPIIALIGPNATHRRVMAKALGSSDARNVREFIDYPANLGDIPHLMEEKFDVLMIDVDSDQSYALQIIESIAAYNTTVVMAYSMRNDANLIADCMRAGARDFLPLPEDASTPAQPEPEPEPAPEPQLVSVPEPVPPPEPVSEAAPEPPINPADFLRSSEAQVAAVEEEPPLNPADFLLATPRQVPEPSAAAPSFQPKEYSVPSRSQFVDPRRSAPPAAPPAAFQPVPKPVAKPAQQPIPLPPPTPEARRSNAPPVLPDEVRQSAGSTKPAKQEARVPEAKKDEIDAWDSLWIKPALGGVAKAPEPSAVAGAEVPAKKNPAQPVIQSGPQLVAQRASAKAAAPAPSTAPAAPMFRAVDSETSSEAPRSWVRWAVLGGVAVAVIAAVMMVFMPSRHAGAPAPSQVQPAASQPQSPAPDATVPAGTEATSKPPAGTPLKAEQAEPAPVSSAMMDAQLHAPTRISGTLHKPVQQADEPPSGFTTGGIEGGGALPGQVFDPARGVKVVPGVSAISAGVADGMLVHKTAPVYPEIAKRMKIGGVVKLEVTVDAEGKVIDVKAMSGNRVLSEAAEDAVRKWKFVPGPGQSTVEVDLNFEAAQ